LTQNESLKNMVDSGNEQLKEWLKYVEIIDIIKATY
jgi:hypothetical protein